MSDFLTNSSSRVSILERRKIRDLYNKNYPDMINEIHHEQGAVVRFDKKSDHKSSGDKSPGD